MATIIIVIILIIILAFALRGSLKHFKGEGGCCGGGSDPKPKKKKIQGDVIATKIVKIEGMHCEHCKNRVEAAVAEIDGAVAKVNLKKQEAVVQMTKVILADELRNAIEKAGYTVVSIQ